MSLRVFLADDEPLARERLRRLLQEAGYTVCGEAANGEQALAAIAQLHPDLVLLDIRMPGKDGLQTAWELSQAPFPPAIIFTTAYDDYLLEAFRVSAQGYLLKPIRREALLEALSRADSVNQAQLLRLRRELAPRRSTPTLLCRTTRGEQRVPLEEILFLHADQKLVSVRTLTEELLTDSSLREIEQQFPDFLRIHRQMLVNADHLLRLERADDGHYHVQLRHWPTPLPVSRRLVTQIRDFLHQTD